MTDTQLRSPHSLRREVSSDGGSLFTALRRLWPYIWPADRRDLRRRVWLATLLLLVAKAATVAVPFTFKWATDALVGQNTAPFPPDPWLSSWLTWVIRTHRDDRRLWRHAHPDGGLHAIARWTVRKGCVIPRCAGLRFTFEHMHQLAALPSRTQDGSDPRISSAAATASRPSFAW
jgi:hypothetical protein